MTVAPIKILQLVILPRVCRIIAEFIAGHSWVFERTSVAIRTRPSSLCTLTACSLNRKLLLQKIPRSTFGEHLFFWNDAATVGGWGERIDVLHKVFMGPSERSCFLACCLRMWLFTKIVLTLVPEMSKLKICSPASFFQVFQDLF